MFKPFFQIAGNCKYLRQEQAPALRNLCFILYNRRGLAALSTVFAAGFHLRRRA